MAPAAPFEPLRSACHHSSGLTREHDIWDLANKVMAKGWSAVTCPETFAAALAETAASWPEVTALRAIRAELLSPFGDAVTPIALSLVDDYVPSRKRNPKLPLDR